MPPGWHPGNSKGTTKYIQKLHFDKLKEKSTGYNPVDAKKEFVESL
jgi:hypothetical protein